MFNVFLETIWQRWIFKKTLYQFLINISLFFLIFVFIDISSRTSLIKGMSCFEVCKRYGFLFSLRFLLFTPLTFLISVIQIILQMHQKGQIIALRSLGVSSFKLQKPFLFMGLILTAGMYLNSEYFSEPTAYYFRDQNLQPILTFQSYSPTVLKLPVEKPFEVINNMELSTEIPLIERTGTHVLIYGSSSNQNSCLEDVYWLISSKYWIHAKKLNLGEKFVASDVIIWSANGKQPSIIKQTSKLILKPLFNFNELTSQIITNKDKSIRTLYKEYSFRPETSVKSWLNFKLLELFYPFIVLCFSLPFLNYWQRNLQNLKIYLVSVLFYILFNIYIQFIFTFAESGVLSIFWAIWIPTGVYCCLTVKAIKKFFYA